MKKQCSFWKNSVFSSFFWFLGKKKHVFVLSEKTFFLCFFCEDEHYPSNRLDGSYYPSRKTSGLMPILRLVVPEVPTRGVTPLKGLVILSVAAESSASVRRADRVVDDCCRAKETSVSSRERSSCTQGATRTCSNNITVCTVFPKYPASSHEVSRVQDVSVKSSWSSLQPLNTPQTSLS